MPPAPTAHEEQRTPRGQFRRCFRDEGSTSFPVISFPSPLFTSASLKKIVCLFEPPPSPKSFDLLQGSAKRRSLGCVNLCPSARGSQDVVFTQPRAPPYSRSLYSPNQLELDEHADAVALPADTNPHAFNGNFRAGGRAGRQGRQAGQAGHRGHATCVG